MLTSDSEGNKKIFRANTAHPLFREIHSIVMKHIGLDQVIENVIQRLGDVQRVYLVGDFSKGIDSQVIDLIFVGDFDKTYLTWLVEKVGKIGRTENSLFDLRHPGSRNHGLEQIQSRATCCSGTKPIICLELMPKLKLIYNAYESLKKRKNTLAVVGLGYVGLPIALEFARHFRVIGFDINSSGSK